MSDTVTLITPSIDRTLFSLHPEEEMTERRGHDLQLEYFKFALQRTLPDLFVARETQPKYFKHLLRTEFIHGLLLHTYII